MMTTTYYVRVGGVCVQRCVWIILEQRISRFNLHTDPQGTLLKMQFLLQEVWIPNQHPGDPAAVAQRPHGEQQESRRGAHSLFL